MSRPLFSSLSAEGRATCAAWWVERLTGYDDKREAFRSELLAIMETARTDRFKTDYDPWDHLLEAVQRAGIPCRGVMDSCRDLLPYKTSMIVNHDGPRGLQVIVREGRGAPDRVLLCEGEPLRGMP